MGYRLLSEIFAFGWAPSFSQYLIKLAQFVTNQHRKWWLAKALINSLHVR